MNHQFNTIKFDVVNGVGLKLAYPIGNSKKYYRAFQRITGVRKNELFLRPHKIITSSFVKESRKFWLKTETVSQYQYQVLHSTCHTNYCHNPE